MSFKRIAAMSGFIFTGLAITNGVLLGQPPFPEADLAMVREYVEHGRGLHKAALIILHVAIGFVVVFFAGLANHLRDGDRKHNEEWGLAAFGSAILGGAAAVVGNTLYALLVYRGGIGLDDSMLQILKDGELIGFSAMGVSIAVVAVCAAVPTFKYRVLPLWHGILSIVVAILSLLGTIAMVSATQAGGWLSSLATLGFVVWVVSTSTVLLRHNT